MALICLDVCHNDDRYIHKDRNCICLLYAQRSWVATLFDSSHQTDSPMVVGNLKRFTANAYVDDLEHDADSIFTCALDCLFIRGRRCSGIQEPAVSENKSWLARRPSMLSEYDMAL